MSRAKSRTCHGKVRYRDNREAFGALRRIQRNSTKQKQPQRYYFCTGCNGWHLTSKPQRSTS